MDESVPATFSSDQDYLRKIIINLSGNAIKFTDSGGIDIGFRMNDEQHLLIAVRGRWNWESVRRIKNCLRPVYTIKSIGRSQAQRFRTGSRTLSGVHKLLEGEIGVSSTLGKDPPSGFNFPFNPATNSKLP